MNLESIEEDIGPSGLVADGLRFFGDGMAPFVDRLMIKRLGNDWLRQTKRAGYRLGETPPNKHDPSFQFKLLLDHKHLKLKERPIGIDIVEELGWRANGLLLLLREERNTWAHPLPDLDLRRAHFTLELMHRLLRQVKAELQAQKVARLLDLVESRMASKQHHDEPKPIAGSSIDRPAGVTASLWINLGGKPTELSIDRDGLAEFDLEAGDALILRLTHSRPDVYGFEANTSKEVWATKNHGSGDYRDYRRVVKIQECGDAPGLLEVAPDDIGLHVIEFEPAGDCFAVYKLRLIAKPLGIDATTSNGFYLDFIQLHHGLNLYQDDGHLRCPQLQDSPGDEWHELVDFIENLVVVEDLPVAPC